LSNAIRISAPAKINLALHVTGQRADGYHLLDSLVTFTEYGDELTIAAADADEFVIDGPFAAQLQGDEAGNNLAVKARDTVRALAAGRPCPPVSIQLTKNLPIASGLGGGSSDAAAALLGLNRLWGLLLTAEELRAAGLSLGADVPMCLAGKPLRAAGIGEEITLLGGFPALDLVLVNPGVGVSTAAIFKALMKKDNRPMSSKTNLSSFHAACEYLSAQHNDLQRPAIAIEPVIADCLAALADNGAMLTRMSGSGATCFGIFTNAANAARAARGIAAARPGWWTVAVKSIAA
jgi:4-diphosphocytidyl-2-C-methyl-D-erythritol kinase